MLVSLISIAFSSKNMVLNCSIFSKNIRFKSLIILVVKGGGGKLLVY